MSHFTVMVIGNNPEKQLAPFDEGIEMPEYKREQVSDEDITSFIEYYAKKENSTTKSELAILPTSIDNLYTKRGDEWNGGRWKKHTDGTWWEYSTYNPKSKWDWYSLGGRWSGLIKLKNGANGKKGKSGVYDNETGIDQAKKGDIENINELTTYAVLKDGEWYERGEMGWFGMSSNEMDENEWDTKFKELITNLPDDTLISIYDCHI